MGFEIMHHYLVQARPEAMARVGQALDPSLAEFVLAPVIIGKQHLASLPGSELQRAHEVQVKLTFLAMLQVDKFALEPARFQALFGSDQLTEGLFDNWWQLTETDYEYFVELTRFVLQAKAGIPATGHPLVDDWLTRGIQENPSTSTR